MRKYSEITFYFFTVFDCYPNFGIGDFVASTTPMAFIEQTFTFHRGVHLPTFTDEFVFHHVLLENHDQNNVFRSVLVLLKVVHFM